MAPASRNQYHGRRTPAAVRLAAAAGIACPPAASLVLLTAGWLSPGYDPLRSTVSRLGQHGQPFALPVNLSMAALGLALVAVAWALDRSVGGRARAGAGLLAVAGAALIGVALVSRDPARPAAHRLVALLYFLSLSLAPLLVWGRLRVLPSWRGCAALSLATAAASLALLLVGVVGVVRGGLPAGAWERTFTALNLVWLSVVALRLLRPSRQSDTSKT